MIRERWERWKRGEIGRLGPRGVPDPILSHGSSHGARSLPDRLRLMAAYLRAQAEDVPGPSALSLETTVRCNLRCPMCPRTEGGFPQADMADDILFPLLEQHAALGGDYLFLYGLGEPFLDPRLFDVLRRCRRLGLGSIVSTNGSYLDPERRRWLLSDPCDHLIVSIDAATRPTFDRYRTGGDFARVVEQTRALAQEKHQRRSRMVLTVQMVVMEGNRGEAEAFQRFWGAVPGVDLVRFKEEEFGIPEHVLYGQDGHMRDNPCRILWRGPMLVRYTGDVYSCFLMTTHGAPLGNLRDRSLAELWNSPENVHLRRLHGAGRAGENPACAVCPCARPRLPFILGHMALRWTTAQRLIPVAERLSQLGRLRFSEPRAPREGEGGR